MIPPLKTSVAHRKQHRAHVMFLSQSHDLSAVDADAITLTHLPKHLKLTDAPRSARAFKHLTAFSGF